MRDYLETLQDEAVKNPEQLAREHSKKELPKRFYKEATAAQTDDGFAIHLDGKSVKTPGKKTLLLPRLDIAQAVAEEWAAQEKEINPALMPLTRIANSAQDAVSVRFEEVADEITRFCGTDALCYRADDPDTLVERQAAQWAPVLAWAEELLGERFVLVEGLMHKPQSDALLQAYRARLNDLDAFELAALHTVTSISGSAVLALALVEKAFDKEAIWAAAYLDEDFNIERWGTDPEAERVRDYKRKEYEAACVILQVS